MASTPKSSKRVNTLRETPTGAQPSSTKSSPSPLKTPPGFQNRRITRSVRKAHLVTATPADPAAKATAKAADAAEATEAAPTPVKTAAPSPAKTTPKPSPKKSAAAPSPPMTTPSKAGASLDDGAKTLDGAPSAPASTSPSASPSTSPPSVPSADAAAQPAPATQKSKPSKAARKAALRAGVASQAPASQSAAASSPSLSSSSPSPSSMPPTQQVDLDTLIREATAALKAQKQTAAVPSAAAPPAPVPAAETHRREMVQIERKLALRTGAPSARSMFTGAARKTGAAARASAARGPLTAPVALDPAVLLAAAPAATQANVMVAKDREVMASLLKTNAVVKYHHEKDRLDAHGAMKPSVETAATYAQEVRARNHRRVTSAGPKWFDMAGVLPDAAMQQEIDVLRARSALAPTQHYRKADKLGPVFQMGHVVHSATDTKTEAGLKRLSKKTIIDSLVEDTQTRSWFKSRYSTVMSKHTDGGKEWYKAQQAQKQQVRKRYAGAQRNSESNTIFKRRRTGPP